MNQQKIKIAIIGASGYTGRELIRILLNHPNAGIKAISSRSYAGKTLGEVFENLSFNQPSERNNLSTTRDLKFCLPDEIDFKAIDLVFFATPHGKAMKMVTKALKYSKVIDLSADFRIQDLKTWEKWYETKHLESDWVSKAVYGLSEIYPKQIANSKLIANPGCYPTSILLALIPLIQNNIIDGEIITDCKSGTSGAGAKANLSLNLSEIGNNFKMYSAFNHRHVPEIVEQINNHKLKANLTFTASLLPIPRGMMSSIYLKNHSGKNAFEILSNFYQNTHFVKVLQSPKSSQVKSVLGTNVCILSVYEENDRLLIVSAIDNLLKGASGQAVQNMNLMFGYQEHLGLEQFGIYP